MGGRVGGYIVERAGGYIASGALSLIAMYLKMVDMERQEQHLFR